MRIVAADTAIEWSKAQGGDGLGDATKPGLRLQAEHRLFDKLVYGKVQAAFGGELTWAISGGAALGERLGHYFRGMGVNIMEGWGLTETSAAATVNRPSMQKIGTVGVPLPGFEARLSDEGEILQLGRFEVEVIDMDDRRIDKLLFKQVVNKEDEAEAVAAAGTPVVAPQW